MIHRAGSTAKAETLEHRLIDISEDDGYQKVASPRGLDDATCLSRGSQSDTSFTCYVTVGRYVGVVDDASSLTDAQQQISAQYVLLTRAPQN